MSYVVPFGWSIETYVFVVVYLSFISGAVAIAILLGLCNLMEKHTFRRYFRCLNDTDTAEIGKKLGEIDNAIEFLADKTNDPYWKSSYNNYQHFITYLRKKPY